MLTSKNKLNVLIVSILNCKSLFEGDTGCKAVSSVLHDPSEIILIFLFGAKKKLFLLKNLC